MYHTGRYIIILDAQICYHRKYSYFTLCYHCCHIYIALFTCTGAPQLLVITLVNSTTVTVSWSEVQCFNGSGAISVHMWWCCTECNNQWHNTDLFWSDIKLCVHILSGCSWSQSEDRVIQQSCQCSSAWWAVKHNLNSFDCPDVIFIRSWLLKKNLYKILKSQENFYTVECKWMEDVRFPKISVKISCKSRHNLKKWAPPQIFTYQGGLE